MEEKILINGNPNGSVFGLVGNDASTDEGKFYVKITDDSKNIGWKEIPPTPTPTQTVSITPSKTPIVTRTPTPNPTLAPYRDWETDRKSTRLNSSHSAKSRMPSSA